MIKSMTGYGRGECEKNNRKVTLEISTVNHRYCDLTIRMPKMLTRLEEHVRKHIKSVITRGKVEVNLYYTSLAEEDVEVVFNEAVCHAALKGLREVGERLHLPDDLTLSQVLALPEVMTLQKKAMDVEQVQSLVEESLAQALEQLVAMRIQEGKHLKADLLEKIEIVSYHVEALEKLSPTIVKDYQEKLKDRIQKLVLEEKVDDARLAVEVALFADKSAIDEEITRLKSHLIQLEQKLSKEEPVGRQLDFMMQEMNREANTIASKANSYQITDHAIILKTEIEKMREQIQNIE